eukprot:scaffold7667_cov164-Skeletonema_menzelii.AAC.2
MAHAEEDRGRGRFQPHAKDKVPPSSLMHLSSRYDRRQRMLNRFKLPKPKITQQNESTQKIAPMTAGHDHQEKKLDRFLQKNQPKLTIATTDSTCTRTSSLLTNNYSFDSKDESFASFDRTPKTPSDGDLFSEWLQLHACSGERAPSYTERTPSYTVDDEAYEQEEFRRTRTTIRQSNNEKINFETPRDCHSDNEAIKSESPRKDRHSDNEAIKSESPRDRHSDNEAINSETPRDLLSGNYYSFASSADTMTPMSNRIQTPSEIASASCSFKFDSFALSMLKSVGNQFKTQIVNGLIVDEEYFDSCDDNSSCSAYSR